MSQSDLRPSAPIGYQARLFGTERSIHEEFAFAAEAGFQALQFRGAPSPMAENLGDLTAAARLLREFGLVPVLELLVALDEQGLHEGAPARRTLEANLPLIQTLDIELVHWHLYTLTDAPLNPVLEALPEQCAQAVELAQIHGFRMAIENNSPEGQLFVRPWDCRQMLDQVPGLGLVWDLNHTEPGDLSGFKELAHRVQMVHVSDSPLPETNHHLPVGLGTVPVDTCLNAIAADHGACGALILEIGGHVVSGGHGRDTDEALRKSRRRLEDAWKTSPGGRS